MAKEWSKSFYNSKRWQQCRDSYIQERLLIDGGLCEECHENTGYIVHHTIVLSPENIRDPEIALSHKHMKYVCKSCHDQYEGHGVGHRKVRPLCIFDEQGQPISMREIDQKKKVSRGCRRGLPPFVEGLNSQQKTDGPG